MYIRVRRINPPMSIFLYHALFFLLSIAFLFPSDHLAVPIFIMLIGLLVTSAIITPKIWVIKRSRVDTRNGSRELRGSRYEHSIAWMLFGSVSMFAFIFITEFISSVDYGTVFIIASFFSIFISSYYYLSNSEGSVGKGNKMTAWAIRVVSIISSFIILSWSKVAAMGYMDLTYNDASSRMIIYAYSIMILLITAIPISGFIYMFVSLYETKVIERVYKNGSKTKKINLKYNSLPIAIPLIMITTAFLMCYGKHHNVVDAYIVRKSIELDSAEGFWCGGGYKTLGTNVDARFIKLSEKDYRAFIFKGNNISSYRLSCLSTYPYYEMKFVLIKASDIRMQMKADEINNDLKIVTNTKG
ncbi:hypothetical protein sch_22425 [Serratia plymuthica]|nr:hypothetical protein sch_22425 [Serratia plymuthica]